MELVQDDTNRIISEILGSSNRIHFPQNENMNNYLIRKINPCKIDYIRRYKKNYFIDSYLKIPWRPEQCRILQDFHRFVESEEENIFTVQAIFGAGKTTMMKAMCNFLSMNRYSNYPNISEKNILITAFNKNIENSYKLYFKTDVNVKTYDAIIFEALGKTQGSGKAKMFDNNPDFDRRRKKVYKDLLKLLQGRHSNNTIKFILVDECQDLDTELLEFFSVYYPKAKMIFFGDFFQSIRKEPKFSLLYRLLMAVENNEEQDADEMDLEDPDEMDLEEDEDEISPEPRNGKIILDLDYRFDRFGEIIKTSRIVLHQMLLTPRVPQLILDPIRRMYETHYIKGDQCQSSTLELFKQIKKWKHCGNDVTGVDIQLEKYKTKEDIQILLKKISETQLSPNNNNSRYQSTSDELRKYTPQDTMILNYHQEIQSENYFGGLHTIKESLSYPYQQENKICPINYEYKKEEPGKYLVTTFSSCKGLERDHVIMIIDCNIDNEAKTQTADIVVNLLGVAMSRCKKSLLILYPAKGKKHELIPCSFLNNFQYEHLPSKNYLCKSEKELEDEWDEEPPPIKNTADQLLKTSNILSLENFLSGKLRNSIDYRCKLLEYKFLPHTTYGTARKREVFYDADPVDRHRLNNSVNAQVIDKYLFGYILLHDIINQYIDFKFEKDSENEGTDISTDVDTSAAVVGTDVSRQEIKTQYNELLDIYESRITTTCTFDELKNDYIVFLKNRQSSGKITRISNPDSIEIELIQNNNQNNNNQNNDQNNNNQNNNQSNNDQNNNDENNNDENNNDQNNNQTEDSTTVMDQEQTITIKFSDIDTIDSWNVNNFDANYEVMCLLTRLHFLRHFKCDIKDYLENQTLKIVMKQYLHFPEYLDYRNSTTNQLPFIPNLRKNCHEFRHTFANSHLLINGHIFFRRDSNSEIEIILFKSEFKNRVKKYTCRNCHKRAKFAVCHNTEPTHCKDHKIHNMVLIPVALENNTSKIKLEAFCSLLLSVNRDNNKFDIFSDGREKKKKLIIRIFNIYSFQWYSLEFNPERMSIGNMAISNDTNNDIGTNNDNNNNMTDNIRMFPSSSNGNNHNVDIHYNHQFENVKWIAIQLRKEILLFNLECFLSKKPIVSKIAPENLFFFDGQWELLASGEVKWKRVWLLQFEAFNKINIEISDSVTDKNRIKEKMDAFFGNNAFKSENIELLIEIDEIVRTHLSPELPLSYQLVQDSLPSDFWDSRNISGVEKNRLIFEYIAGIKTANENMCCKQTKKIIVSATIPRAIMNDFDLNLIDRNGRMDSKLRQWNAATLTTKKFYFHYLNTTKYNKTFLNNLQQEENKDLLMISINDMIGPKGNPLTSFQNFWDISLREFIVKERIKFQKTFVFKSMNFHRKPNIVERTIYQIAYHAHTNYTAIVN